MGAMGATGLTFWVPIKASCAFDSASLTLFIWSKKAPLSDSGRWVTLPPIRCESTWRPACTLFTFGLKFSHSSSSFTLVKLVYSFDRENPCAADPPPENETSGVPVILKFSSRSSLAKLCSMLVTSYWPGKYFSVHLLPWYFWQNCTAWLRTTSKT